MVTVTNNKASYVNGIGKLCFKVASLQKEVCPLPSKLKTWLVVGKYRIWTPHWCPNSHIYSCITYIGVGQTYISKILLNVIMYFHTYAGAFLSAKINPLIHLETYFHHHNCNQLQSSVTCSEK